MAFRKNIRNFENEVGPEVVQSIVQQTSPRRNPDINYRIET